MQTSPKYLWDICSAGRCHAAAISFDAERHTHKHTAQSTRTQFTHSFRLPLLRMLQTSYPFFVKQSLEMWHRNNGIGPLCARLLRGLLETSLSASYFSQSKWIERPKVTSTHQPLTLDWCLPSVNECNGSWNRRQSHRLVRIVRHGTILDFGLWRESQTKKLIILAKCTDFQVGKYKMEIPECIQNVCVQNPFPNWCGDCWTTSTKIPNTLIQKKRRNLSEKSEHRSKTPSLEPRENPGFNRRIQLKAAIDASNCNKPKWTPSNCSQRVHGHYSFLSLSHCHIGLVLPIRVVAWTPCKMRGEVYVFLFSEVNFIALHGVADILFNPSVRRCMQHESNTIQIYFLVDSPNDIKFYGF